MSGISNDLTKKNDMNFTKLVPIFYGDINDCLRFKIEYNELSSTRPFCVMEKKGLCVNLFRDRAEEHHPEFRLVTDNIAEVYDTIHSSHPELLYPNLSKVTLRSWGEGIRDHGQAAGIIYSNGNAIH